MGLLLGVFILTILCLTFKAKVIREADDERQEGDVIAIWVLSSKLLPFSVLCFQVFGD